MCILEREREHIVSICSRVTCLAVPLVATQSLARTKRNKQINKQYTKQCLITKQTVPKDATHRYECVRIRIT
jgi:hypothetical protein